MNDDKYIEELKALNKHCSFNDIKAEYHYVFRCENELEFKRFQRISHCIVIINRDSFKWRLLVQMAEENKRIYQAYISQVMEMQWKISNQEIWQKFQKLIISEPVTEPNIVITAEYISPRTGKELTKVHIINYFKIKEQMPYIRIFVDEKKPTDSLEIQLKNYILTREYLKHGISLIEKLKPFEFEVWICNLMNECDYTAFTTTKSGDYGADVIADKDNTRIAIQCKLTKHTLGIRCVQEVIAGMHYYHAQTGWVMSTAPDFTSQAYNLADVCQIKLFTKKDLETLLNSICSIAND